MGDYKNKQNLDRYLYSRNVVYNYVRHVPEDVVSSDFDILMLALALI